jgi:hypothetical protein
VLSVLTLGFFVLGFYVLASGGVVLADKDSMKRDQIGEPLEMAVAGAEER